MSTVSDRPHFVPTHEHVAALDRLGDEIAELAAHLDAATARLLELIREFDARGGWNTGFTSCAEWLAWRIGLEPGAAREHVRVARALGSLPLLSQALARGELSYSNLALLCRRHHRAVHEEGYQVERSQDGTLRFRRPDGHTVPDLPPPAPVPADPVGALRERSEGAGLRLDARTTCPEWDGEPLDLGYALDVLHPEREWEITSRGGLVSPARHRPSRPACRSTAA